MAAKVLFCVALLVLATLGSRDGPEVETKNGGLVGKYMKTKLGRKFSGFLGIPYAKPPIGDLRFKDPIPADPWGPVREAKKDSAVCFQRNPYIRSDLIEGDEDCLYLNVYTPQLPSYGSDMLPVMVFFHGGGWVCGAGTSGWYGPEILLDRDVVLVVPNFRLGPLGFLSTQDDTVPGNMGLKDQALALKWVKENIAAFGGDRNLVTAFGESAGAASVQFHMMSPLSKDLIHRGISQSGTALGSWTLAVGNQARENAAKLAKSLNCPTKSAHDMVKCLRKIDARDIIDKDGIFNMWDLDPMIPFKPVIEHEHPGAFLTKHPIEAIKAGEQSDIPWITGITASEGALRAASLFARPHLLEEFNKDFDKIVPVSLMYDLTAPNPDLVTKQIRNFYLGDDEINNNTIHSIVDMYTDGWFLSALDESARLHLSHMLSPLYIYYFDYRGRSSFSEIFGDPSRNYGVCHADELQYLFPVGDALFPDKKPDDADRKVAEILTNLWVNFAKTGNPTPENNEVDGPEWDRVQSSEIEFLHIGGKTDIYMDKGLLADRAHFWTFLPTRKDKHDVIQRMTDEL